MSNSSANERPMIDFFAMSPDVVTPMQATQGSAGADLSACFHAPSVTVYDQHSRKISWPPQMDPTTLKKKVTLPPFYRMLVPTGIVLGIPEPYYVELFVRSSVAIKSGVALPNSVAVIDTDYRGEVFVALINLSDRNFIIHEGDRIAQMIVKRKETDVLFRTVQEAPAWITDRQGGIGSTGTS